MAFDIQSQIPWQPSGLSGIVTYQMLPSPIWEYSERLLLSHPLPAMVADFLSKLLKYNASIPSMAGFPLASSYIFKFPLPFYAARESI